MKYATVELVLLLTVLVLSCSQTAMAQGPSALDKAFPVRGLFVDAPNRSRVDDFCKFIDEELGPNHINTLILAVNYNYRFTSRPEMANPNAIGIEDVEKIVTTCKKHDINVFPLINLLGHQSWSASTGKLLQEYPEFTETPNIKAHKADWPNPDGYYCLSYCPLHPDVHDRDLDGDSAEECLGLFFRDKGHYAYYDVTTSYWAILDGKTNELKYISNDVTSIAESVDCVFRDGQWMLKMDSFKDGKYEVDDIGRITGTKVFDFVGIEKVTNTYKILGTEESVVTFPETIPGLPRGSKTGPVPTFSDREPIETLIMTGINGAHWWQGSTEAIKEMMENTGLFRCDVAVMNGSRNAIKPEDIDFTKYALVVSNHVPGEWPEQAKTNLEQYVKNGGGLVLLHGATLAFANWPQYNEMMGLGAWMNRNENDGPYVYWKDGEFVRDETPGWAGHHGRQHSFVVEHRVPDHPILKGLPMQWLHFKDELYGKMRGPAKNMDILATAYDDTDENRGLAGSDRHEPMLWTVRYGEGRVFVDAMGHAGDDVPAIYALECTGFQVTFLRGCEWAAIGEVMQPVPDDFPTKTEHKFRRDFRP